MTEPLDVPEAPVTPQQIMVFDDEMEEGAAQEMIITVWARVLKVAPCLRVSQDEPSPLDDPVNLQIVKDVVRGAVLRWADRGSGALKFQSSGDFSQTLADVGALLRPNEIRELEEMCGEFTRQQRAATISTATYNNEIVHAPWCSVNFAAGALNPQPGAPVFCNCGSILNNGAGPIWGPANEGTP